MSRLVLRRRPSPALVISLIALFVSLGGSGYAALTVSGKNIRNESITGRDVKAGSLTGRDVKANTLGNRQVKESSLGKVRSAKRADSARTADSVRVAQSASNAAALGGAPAAAFAQRLFAVVNGTAAVPSVVRSSGGVTVTRIGADDKGDYTVGFPQAVSTCAYAVTTGGSGATDQPVRFFTDASRDESNSNRVDVSVRDIAGEGDLDGDFSLIVIC